MIVEPLGRRVVRDSEPRGLARIGDREYNVGLNSSPTDVDRFNELPVGVRNGVTVDATFAEAFPMKATRLAVRLAATARSLP